MSGAARGSSRSTYRSVGVAALVSVLVTAAGSAAGAGTAIAAGSAAAVGSAAGAGTATATGSSAAGGGTATAAGSAAGADTATAAGSAAGADTAAGIATAAGPATAAIRTDRASATRQVVTIQPDQWPRVIDEPGEDRDRIVFTRVPGVVWWYDVHTVSFPEGVDVISVPMPKRDAASDGRWVWSNGARVEARGVDGSTVVAPGALTTMEMHPEWWVGAFRGARSTRAVATLSVGAYPRTIPTSASTTVSFTPFAGSTGLVWGYVQRRTVVANAAGRTVGPWVSLPTFPGLAAGTTASLVAARGSTHEFRVRATDRGDQSAASTVTPWSAPVALGFPQDAHPSTGTLRGDMAVVPHRGAFARSVLRSRSAGGSWTSRPWYGTELALAFAVGPRGSTAEVFVDGRRLAAVSTYDPRTKQRQLRYLVRGLAPDRAHTVTVVNKPTRAARNQLDLDAFIVTSTQ